MDIDRRSFLQGLSAMSALAVGADAVRADEPPAAVKNGEARDTNLVPTRKLGRNGPMISMLALGGDMPAHSEQFLNIAWSLGIRYFDTAAKYGHGQEEAHFARWFSHHPERRKDVFLVSKDYPRQGPEQLLTMIDKRLAACGTDYLDLYFIHQLCPEAYGPASVDWPRSDRFREVAQKLKRSGKCRMVGFSCHGGPEYLQAATEGGFLDALMVQYTPFFEPRGAFDKALTACHDAGIGLIAMKTLRHAGNVPKRLPEFDKLGLTTHQALLQAVWSDPRITAVCNCPQNDRQIQSGVAAVRGYKEPLEISLRAALRKTVLAHRRTMCPGCPGCDAHSAAIAFAFRDIARYVTYYEQDGYQGSRSLYHSLPIPRRDATGVDLAALSAACSFGTDYADIVRRAERYFG